MLNRNKFKTFRNYLRSGIKLRNEDFDDTPYLNKLSHRINMEIEYFDQQKCDALVHIYEVSHKNDNKAYDTKFSHRVWVNYYWGSEVAWQVWEAYNQICCEIRQSEKF